MGSCSSSGKGNTQTKTTNDIMGFMSNLYDKIVEGDLVGTNGLSRKILDEFEKAGYYKKDIDNMQDFANAMSAEAIAAKLSKKDKSTKRFYRILRNPADALINPKDELMKDSLYVYDKKTDTITTPGGGATGLRYNDDFRMAYTYDGTPVEYSTKTKFAYMTEYSNSSDKYKFKRVPWGNVKK